MYRTYKFSFSVGTGVFSVDLFSILNWTYCFEESSISVLERLCTCVCCGYCCFVCLIDVALDNTG